MLASNLGGAMLTQLVAAVGDGDPDTVALVRAGIADLEAKLRARIDDLATEWIGRLAPGARMVSPQVTYNVSLGFTPRGIALSVSTTNEFAIGDASTPASIKGSRSRELLSKTF